MVNDLVDRRQRLLDTYFAARAEGQIMVVGEGCDWCDRFIALTFTCCLNCGYIIEAIE